MWPRVRLLGETWPVRLHSPILDADGSRAFTAGPCGAGRLCCAIQTLPGGGFTLVSLSRSAGLPSL